MEWWGKIIAIIFLGIGTSVLFQKSPVTSNKPTIVTKEAASTEQTTVARTIDGDSVKLSSKQELRYIGVDAPEYNNCFGKEASEENKRLVDGKTIRLEKDVSQLDKYGRLLRYVYVGDLFVNEYLVRQGFSRVETVPPDVKFAKQLQLAEQEARENNRGLWSGCR